MSDSTLPKIDDESKFLEWYNAARVGSYSLSSTYSANPAIHEGLAMPYFYVLDRKDLDFPTPEGEPPENSALYETGRINSTNFWVAREALRLLGEDYRLLLTARRLYNTVPIGALKRVWWHFPHQSMKDPSLVAYTPNAEYGKRDRQVVVKLGRYLTKYFSDVLSEEQIRDMANLNRDTEVKWAHGPDAIYDVYCNGPHSCMKGQEAVRAYGYRYPEADGGDWEFGLAYLIIGGNITARALCSLRHKTFTRHFGDDGPILQSLLEAQGYRKNYNDVADLSLRMLHIAYDERAIVMPYLDGDQQDVYGPFADSAGRAYWTWGREEGRSYDHGLTADCANGIVTYSGNSIEDEDEDDDRRDCDHCGDSTHEDDLHYSDHHDWHICDHCVRNHFVEAYYTRGNDTALVLVEHCQEHVNGDWYLNDRTVFNWHDLVVVTSGDRLADRDDCVVMLGGGYELDGANVLYCGEDTCGESMYDYRCNVTRGWLSADGIVYYHPECVPSWIDTDELFPVDHWLRVGQIQPVYDLVGNAFAVDRWVAAVAGAMQTYPCQPMPTMELIPEEASA